MVAHSLEWSQCSSLIIVDVIVFRIQFLYHVVVVGPGWSEVIMKYHTSLGYSDGVVVT